MEQIITVGDSVELLLDEEMLRRIGVGSGDKVEVKVTNGALTIRPAASDERARKIAELTREIFDDRREAYQELAQGPK